MTVNKNVPKKEWTKLDADEFIVLMFEMYKSGFVTGLSECDGIMRKIPPDFLQQHFNSAVNELFERNNLYLKNKNVLPDNLH